MKLIGSKTKRSIRRGQAVSPFGVGAIYDFGNESLIAKDISRWDPKRLNQFPQIRLLRLELLMGVRDGFRMPPDGTNDSGWQKYGAALPFERFPKWLFCPSCKLMVQWNWELEKDLRGRLPRCVNSNCGHPRTLVPMRFVVACRSGHLGDFPWGAWAHSGRETSKAGRCEVRDQLVFETAANRGSGLESLAVRCSACGSKRSLAGITAKDSLRQIAWPCSGKQPWERSGGKKALCEQIPQVLQRGASNVYYPIVWSALDIKPEEDHTSSLDEEIATHRDFQRISGSANLELPELLLEYFANEIAREVGCSVQEVLGLAKRSSVLGNDGAEVTDSAIRADPMGELLEEEWRALINPLGSEFPNRRFQAESVSIGKIADGTGLQDLIEQVVLVKRLREVRVLRGFHRIQPGDEATLVRPDLGRGMNWLPGYEVFGEGVFIQFQEAAFARWYARGKEYLRHREAVLAQRVADKKVSYLPSPTARLVMLHTLAHLFIRELSFECGYSASSLRERIYAAGPDAKSGPMAGILIYTADSDAEGSLGGLVRQGHPSRLVPLFLRLLQRAAWCSADPVCSESDGQGVLGLNLAACHACALVSETSCVLSNTLLDRMLLTGSQLHPDQSLGFFEPVLQSLMKGN